MAMCKDANLHSLSLHDDVHKTGSTKIAGCSGLVVSASDWGVKGLRFKSHRGRLCLSQQPLEAALGLQVNSQPCVSSGSLNRAPASAGVTWGMSPLPDVR